MPSGPYADDLPDLLLGQQQTLAFDFGRFLPSGVTLSGTPTVTITVSQGAGAAVPANELSGAASIGTVTAANGGSGVTNTAVLQRMIPTVGGSVQYLLLVKCNRSDSDLAALETHVRVVTAE